MTGAIFAGLRQGLDRSAGCEGAGDASERAKHPARGAGEGVPFRLRVEAPPAGTATKQADLDLPGADRRCHQILSSRDAGVRDRQPRRQIICSVDDKIPTREDVGGVLRIQPTLKRNDLDVAVQGVQTLCSGCSLGSTKISFSEDDLALQIRKRDVIEIKQSQTPCAGGRQIEGGGCADTSQARDQDTRTLQGLLTGAAEFPQYEVPGVAFDFPVGE